jgi:hypothetical protein
VDSLKEALEALTHKYYGLAHLLLPDDLMATQLLIDGVTRMMALAPQGLASFDGQDEHQLHELETEFAYHLIELGRIRQQHFAARKGGAIYRLSLEERVVLFLRDKRRLEVSFVAKVLNQREEAVLALTHKARAQLLAASGGMSPKESQFL